MIAAAPPPPLQCSFQRHHGTSCACAGLAGCRCCRPPQPPMPCHRAAPLLAAQQPPVATSQPGMRPHPAPATALNAIPPSHRSPIHSRGPASGSASPACGQEAGFQRKARQVRGGRGARHLVPHSRCRTSALERGQRSHCQLPASLPLPLPHAPQAALCKLVDCCRGAVHLVTPAGRQAARAAERCRRGAKCTASVNGVAAADPAKSINSLISMSAYLLCCPSMPLLHGCAAGCRTPCAGGFLWLHASAATARRTAAVPLRSRACPSIAARRLPYFPHAGGPAAGCGTRGQLWHPSLPSPWLVSSATDPICCLSPLDQPARTWGGAAADDRGGVLWEAHETRPGLPCELPWSNASGRRPAGPLATPGPHPTELSLGCPAPRPRGSRRAWCCR